MGRLFTMNDYYGAADSAPGVWYPWDEAPVDTGIYMVDPLTTLMRQGYAFDFGTSYFEEPVQGVNELAPTGLNWYCAWVRFPSDLPTTNRTAFGNPGGSRGFNLIVRNNGSPQIQIGSTAAGRGRQAAGNIPIGPWSFVGGAYDLRGGDLTIHARVNDDADWTSQTWAGEGYQTGVNPFRIGQNWQVGHEIGAVFGGFGVSNFPTNEQFAALYDAGDGVTFEEAKGILGADLTWYYPLTESSGALTDRVGSLTLNRFGTPVQVDGANSEAGVVGEPVYAVHDLMGNYADAVQTDFARRCILRQDGGGWYYLEADASATQGAYQYIVGGGNIGPIAEVIGVGQMVAPSGSALFAGSGSTRTFGFVQASYQIRWASQLRVGAHGNAWHQVTMKLDGANSEIWSDGVSVGAGEAGNAVSGNQPLIGGSGGSAEGNYAYVQILPNGHNDPAYRARVEAWLKAHYGTP